MSLFKKTMFLSKHNMWTLCTRKYCLNSESESKLPAAEFDKEGKYYYSEVHKLTMLCHLLLPQQQHC